MELTPTTAAVYVRQAFAGMTRVLDRLDDVTVNERPHGPGTNSVAVLVVHCCELAPFWLDHVGLGNPTERDREAEFEATSTVPDLRRLLADTEARTIRLIEELDVGPTDIDNAIRSLMPGDDASDPAIVLHVLEELFQHLGHMEITADALVGPPG